MNALEINIEFFFNAFILFHYLITEELKNCIIENYKLRTTYFFYLKGVILLIGFIGLSVKSAKCFFFLIILLYMSYFCKYTKQLTVHYNFLYYDLNKIFQVLSKT